MKAEQQFAASDFLIENANDHHKKYAERIAEMLEESARARGIGIARRSAEYIAKKMQEGKAIIAFHKPSGQLAGFTYIETWTHDKYVANSGLIVQPEFRGSNLGKRLKHASFALSRKKYPDARIFSITTSHAVMKMNTELGFSPVPFSELTTDKEFWDGCQSCRNYDILMRNDRKMCLCTGLMFDPEEKKKSFQKKMMRNKLVAVLTSVITLRRQRLSNGKLTVKPAMKKL